MAYCFARGSETDTFCKTLLRKSESPFRPSHIRHDVEYRQGKNSRMHHCHRTGCRTAPGKNPPYGFKHT